MCGGKVLLSSSIWQNETSVCCALSRREENRKRFRFLPYNKLRLCAVFMIENTARGSPDKEQVRNRERLLFSFL